MIDKKTLQEHINKNLNMSEIARIYDVSSNTVKKWMKKYDLYSRKIRYNGHNDKLKNTTLKDRTFCKNCNEILSGRNKYKNIYCSNKCQRDYQQKQYIDKWKCNLIKKDYYVSKYIRKYLFEKYNYKCCKCGWGEINKKTNKIPLEIHHINGNPKDHKESNLELLCPNCHSLTCSYKASNKGKGREYRRK